MARKTRRWLFLIVAMACATGLLAGSPARADSAQADGLTISGSGTASGKPTIVELSATISAQAELADDARVKYQDARKKAMAALDALKNPDLAIESVGVSLHGAVDRQAAIRAMQGMGGGAAMKPKIEISEKLKITLKGIDKLDQDKLMQAVLKLIDTCHDAGLELGPSDATIMSQIQMGREDDDNTTLVNFKIPDDTDLENQAYQNAIDDAKAKAQKIASLNGMKLGTILAVYDQNNNDQNANRKEVSSTAFGDIPINARLIVKFEIIK